MRDRHADGARRRIATTTNKGNEMRLSTLFATLIGVVGFTGPAHAFMVEFDLDAANTDASFFGIDLAPGTYQASLRSGTYTAWSNQSVTDEGCTNDCVQGWLNFYGFFDANLEQGNFVENGVAKPFDGYDFSQRRAYGTPDAALAADGPFLFTLNSPSLVFFFIEDCGGCFADNRGGLSFTLNSVPEPGTLALLGLSLAGLGLSRRRKAD